MHYLGSGMGALRSETLALAEGPGLGQDVSV